MVHRDIIVIGASAGGVQAVLELARELPGNLPAALFVAIHTSPSAPGLLPTLLDGAGPLSAGFARHGEKIRHGRIYVAPPDHHLILVDSKVHLSRGPKENGFRPAVDPLFRSASAACGPRVVGIVLSGGLDDGTAGLKQIKRGGGIALVQDPATTMHSSMPDSAIANVDVDRILPVPQMAAVLVDLARGRTAPGGKTMAHCHPSRRRRGAQGPDLVETPDTDLKRTELPGEPSGFVCPECGGALWELTDGKLVKYRCHVGHGFTADGLMMEKTRDLENALWTALRTLEEHAALCRRMAQRVATSPIPSIAREYQRRADDAESRATLVRQVLLKDRIEPGKRDRNGRPVKTNLSRKLARPRRKRARKG